VIALLGMERGVPDSVAETAPVVAEA